MYLFKFIFKTSLYFLNFPLFNWAQDCNGEHNKHDALPQNLQFEYFWEFTDKCFLTRLHNYLIDKSYVIPS
jgi:hypothetical protein